MLRVRQALAALLVAAALMAVGQIGWNMFGVLWVLGVGGAAIALFVALGAARGRRRRRRPRPRSVLLLVLIGLLCVAGTQVSAASPPRPPGSGAGELPRPDPMLRELIGFKVRYKDMLRRNLTLVRTVAVGYRAWNGQRRQALLVLPAWYGPKTHPAIPLVISPHGRGGTARANARLWGGLPAFGPFAVVNPEGQGRRLTAYSWGWRGQIQDLARMPGILERALPWFHVDHTRVYAIGSSMGGQETLLLAALYPKLLVAAAPLDSATDMAARYRAFATTPGEARLQQLARIEIGGTPVTAPNAYAARSPITYARRLATGGVPIDIWWSRNDKIIRNQDQESGRLYRMIKRINPKAPVEQFVGTWAHSHEMHPLARLPLALVDLKIVELDEPLAKTVKP
jgi:poly(3-hydroxybutyrate) depolymerase